MSLARFTHTSLFISATLIASSFAQGASAQGALAQSPPAGGAGPIINGPVIYPKCDSPNRVTLATPRVATCAWAFDVPDDYDPDAYGVLYVATPDTCAPTAYWTRGPKQTDSYFSRGKFWVEISCFHRGR